MAVLIALIAGCGAAVGTAEGGTSGGPGTGTSSSGSSGPPIPAPGSSSDTTSRGSTGAAASSSSGAPPELVEFEGVLRYNADFYKSPIWFETCDGSGIGLDLWTEPGLPDVRFCGGMYARVRGTFEPTGHLGAEQLVVREVLEWRVCEPSDCGGDACEPLQCLWECSPLDQDCGPSDKCVPYPTDGGIVSASACVPIPASPDPLGASCTRDSVTFAADTCGAGAVCMGGFGERAGVCVELCQGSRSDPTCNVGRCVFSSNGGPYCLASCDPEQPDCDGFCTGSPFDASESCVPEPGLPDLLEACGKEGCGGDFVCSQSGPTEGLCVPPP